MATENNIYNNCDNVKLFDKNMNLFYKSLFNTFPEFKHDIGKSFKYYKKCQTFEYIKTLIETLEPHIELISKYDEGIFSNDYQELPMKLLKGLDFKLLFKYINSNIGDGENQYTIEGANTTKKSIFNYLQSIYLSAKMAQNNINDVNNVFNKQKELFIGMFNNLNLNDKIKETLKDLKDEDDSSSFDKVFKIFGIIKEVFADFGDFGDIMGIFSDIFKEINSGNKPMDKINTTFTKKIITIAKNLIKTIKNKFTSGAFTKEKLADKFKLLMTRLKEVFPDFDFDSMTQQCSKIAEENGFGNVFSMLFKEFGVDGFGNYADMFKEFGGTGTNGTEDGTNGTEDEAFDPKKISKMFNEFQEKAESIFGDFIPKEVINQMGENMKELNIEKLAEDFSKEMAEEETQAPTD